MLSVTCDKALKECTALQCYCLMEVSMLLASLQLRGIARSSPDHGEVGLEGTSRSSSPKPLAEPGLSLSEPSRANKSIV